MGKAAMKAKVSARTMTNWLADPAFQAAYRAQRKRIVEHAVGRIQRATEKAVSTLRRNLTCGNPAAENKAAELLLTHALRGLETTEILERLEALEARNLPGGGRAT